MVLIVDDDKRIIANMEEFFLLDDIESVAVMCPDSFLEYINCCEFKKINHIIMDYNLESYINGIDLIKIAYDAKKIKNQHVYFFSASVNAITAREKEILSTLKIEAFDKLSIYKLVERISSEPHSPKPKVMKGPQQHLSSSSLLCDYKS